MFSRLYYFILKQRNSEQIRVLIVSPLKRKTRVLYPLISNVVSVFRPVTKRNVAYHRHIYLLKIAFTQEDRPSGKAKIFPFSYSYFNRKYNFLFNMLRKFEVSGSSRTFYRRLSYSNYGILLTKKFKPS